MSDVNKQLLDALVGMVSMWKATCDAMNWEPNHLAEYDIARTAIAAAEQAQQATAQGCTFTDRAESGVRVGSQPLVVQDGWLPDGDAQIPTEVSAAGVEVLRGLLGADVVGFYEIDQAFRAMLAAAQKP